MTLFSSPIVLVLVGVIGLLIGLLIGFLFIDRDSRRSKAMGVPEEYIKDGFIEISRMMYSPIKKRIVAGLDGEYFKAARDLSPDQHARLTKVLRIWNDWNNISTAAVDESETPAVENLEQPKPEAVEAATVEAPTALPVENEVEPAPVAPVAEGSVFSTDDFAPAEPLTATPFFEETVMAGVPVEEPETGLPQEEAPTVDVSNKTIVEQINQMLQDMLPGTAYELRGLTLHDDSQNGVLVYAGSEKFNSIEEVPYPDAQELIRNAVSEWERKYESEQNKPG